MTNFRDIVDTISRSTSGTFVGITDYISETGDVSSVTGHIGCSYGVARNKSIKLLETAIAEDDFDAITITGECYWDAEKQEYNARKRSCELKSYDITFSKDEVVACAESILESWKKPKKINSNKVQFTEKENGLYFEEETGNYNMKLLVEHQTYKGNVGEEKSKISAPITILKNKLRKRFEQKIKAFTIGKDKFKKLSINGTVYTDGELSFG